MEKIIKVKVVPRSSKAGVVGWEDGILKVRVSSAPVDGKANRELIQLLSSYFKTDKSRVTIVSGEKSRLKRLIIQR